MKSNTKVMIQVEFTQVGKNDMRWERAKDGSQYGRASPFLTE